jgi:hypothetical protein
VSGIDWASLKKTADDATKPLPKDWYEVVVDSAERKTASTGSEMISVKLKVDAGPHAGRMLFTNFVLSPDSGFALSLFFRNMAALGITDEYFGQLSASGMDVQASLTSIAQVIVGRRARVEVGVRQWQGQDRNEVTNMQAASTGAGGVPGGSGPITGPQASFAGGPPVPPATPPVPPSAPPTPPAATSGPTTDNPWGGASAPAGGPQLPF